MRPPKEAAEREGAFKILSSNKFLQPTEDVLPREELVRVVLEDLEVLEVDVEQGEVRLLEGGPAGHLLDDLARLAREVGEGEGRRVPGAQFNRHFRVVPKPLPEHVLRFG